MMRKLTVVLLSGLICLLGAAPVLAYNEAPMLRQMVAAGELPPVEERLPEEPLVVKPLEEIGEYGGTLHTMVRSSWMTYMAANAMGAYQGLLRLGRDLKSVTPNVAKDWEFSKDGKTLTFYLRKGMKWSDGEPFTADDILFWYEDFVLNEKLNPVVGKDFCPGGEPMVMEKVNDYTIRLKFVVPVPFMPYIIFHLPFRSMEGFPKHYLKQFHIKYNPNADELAKEEGYDNWWGLFNNKASFGVFATPTDTVLPVITSYVLKEKTASYFLYERNPYFWQVDTEGNQLPYIDRVYAPIVTDPEMVTAKIVTGMVDLVYGTSTGLGDLSVYKKSEKSGNYRVLLYPNTSGVDITLQPNQTSNDPVLREIFQNLKFRIALSLAIDREEINEMVYFGLGVPRQNTVIPETSYYKPEFAKAYAEYDPEEADRLLDEIGLKWDENHEYRLRPDGKKLSWIIEYTELLGSWTPTVELVKEYWKEIGVDVSLKTIGSDLLGVRTATNEINMTVFCTDRAEVLFPIKPLYYVPMSVGWELSWGTLWARWYTTDGKEGEEPPEKVMRLLRLWEKMKITMDKEERTRLGTEILRSQAENLWTIGTVGCIPQPIIVRNNLRNIPEEGVFGYDFLASYPYHPEQFFFKHPLLPSQK